MTNLTTNQSITIDAEIRVPLATAQLVGFHLPDPTDEIIHEDSYWIDLCLTPRPRNTRACYCDHWAPHRFELLGNLFLVPPHQIVRAKCDGSCSWQRSVVFRLQPEPMREWLEGDLEWTGRRLEASVDIRHANIRSLLLRLAQELHHPGFASNVLVETIAAQMTVELGRYCTAVREPNSQGGLAPWRLKLIDERLKEVDQLPTLAELAKLCHPSVRQLTRTFRASRGCSIGEYVAQCQVVSAKRQLVNGQRIKSIALSLGFSTASSFCCAFRRATGETPTQFRERMSR